MKHALLCRILVYIIILGMFIAPIAIVVSIESIPAALKVIVAIGLPIGLIVYLLKNFVFLLYMDISFALLRCHNTARKRFILPKGFSVQKAERRLSRFGRSYEPIAISPRPDLLQYKSSTPMTIYSKGIEKVVVTYHTDLLTKEQYHSIFHSATANARALKGKKQHRLLDKEQKSSPLNCVTAIIIYAKHIDEPLRSILFDLVCKNSGDGFDTAVLPCVIDLEKQTCTFNSERIPYIGFQYPVKNRGIRIIRKALFHNRLPLTASTDTLDPIQDLDPEQGLWAFWRAAKKDVILNDKAMKKQFQNMKHKEIVCEEGYAYVKWQDRGIWLTAERNEESKTVVIDKIEFWTFPKRNQISKETIKELQALVNTHFAQLGYGTQYISRN